MRAKNVLCFRRFSLQYFYLSFLYSDDVVPAGNVNEVELCMKFPDSSAVKFFTRCTSKQTFSHSFTLLSGVTFSCLISSSANFSFVKFFIMSSASSGDST